MAGKREVIVYTAKLAQQAHRYDDMFEALKKLAMIGKELTVEEMNLYSVAYNNVIGSRVASCRRIGSIEQIEEQRGAQTRVELIKKYRIQLENELRDICLDSLDVLNKYLIPTASTGKSKIFYYEIKGNFYNYLANFGSDTCREEQKVKSRFAYKAACDLTLTELLGLGLDISLLYYKMLKSPALAYRSARALLDQAIAVLDTLGEECLDDLTKRIQLFREKFSLWKFEKSPKPEAQLKELGSTPKPEQ